MLKTQIKSKQIKSKQIKPLLMKKIFVYAFCLTCVSMVFISAAKKPAAYKSTDLNTLTTPEHQNLNINLK